MLYTKELKRFILKWSETLGIIIFLLTFWFPKGFFLGGNPVFLGKFLSELEIVFPVCGIGIFIVFFAQYFLREQKNLSYPNLFFFLFFLGFSAVSSIFSLAPKFSILFLILWATGFLSFNFLNKFFIQYVFKRSLLFFSILTGYFISCFFPDFGVSVELLGISSILGIIFAMKEDRFKGRFFWLLFYSWVVFSTGYLSLIIFTMLLLFGAKIWLPPSRGHSRRWEILGILLFLLGLLIWGFFESSFVLDFNWGFIHLFFSSLGNILIGVGEGQYLVALQKFSETILIPENLVLPSSGLLLVFFEKGILGLLLFLFLIVSKFIFSEKRTLFFPFLFFIFLIFTSDLIATENGFLFMMVFLFADEEKFVNNI